MRICILGVILLGVTTCLFASNPQNLKLTNSSKSNLYISYISYTYEYDGTDSNGSPIHHGFSVYYPAENDYSKPFLAPGQSILLPLSNTDPNYPTLTYSHIWFNEIALNDFGPESLNCEGGPEDTTFTITAQSTDPKNSPGTIICAPTAGKSLTQPKKQ